MAATRTMTTCQPAAGLIAQNCCTSTSSCFKIDRLLVELGSQAASPAIWILIFAEIRDNKWCGRKDTHLYWRSSRSSIKIGNVDSLVIAMAILISKIIDSSILDSELVDNDHACWYISIPKLMSLHSRINNRDARNTCPVLSVCFCDSRRIRNSEQVC